jgi:1,4-dihydroxy-2-naphthoate octaprenyltransferase
MISKLFKIYPPVVIILGILTYTLGTGIARYLGFSIKILTFILGLLALLALQSAAYFLVEYFRLPLTPREKDESLTQRERYRVLLLQISYAALAFAMVIILVLVANRAVKIVAGIFYLIAFILMVVYSIPPMRLSEKGYGELIQAVYLGTVLPTAGFLLQYGAGELHRLLTFVTFPLTLLALSFLLIHDFPTFATDQKLAHNTFLTRLSWQYAIPVHHVLIIFTFLFFSAAPLLNVPWGVVWPVFLALPFGIVQVFWLQRIASGGPAFWSFLTALSTTTFGLSVYLLALTFWVR